MRKRQRDILPPRRKDAMHGARHPSSSPLNLPPSAPGNRIILSKGEIPRIVYIALAAGRGRERTQHRKIRSCNLWCGILRIGVRPPSLLTSDRLWPLRRQTGRKGKVVRRLSGWLPIHPPAQPASQPHVRLRHQQILGLGHSLIRSRHIEGLQGGPRRLPRVANLTSRL